jgi:hypothetical protein
MKYGILTFHEVLNYGAILQNYALQKIVGKINEEINIETIDLHRSYFENKTKLFKIDNKNKVKSTINNMVLYPYKSKRKKLFEQFISKNIKMSKKINNTNEIIDYDGFIVGSDQVWNPEIINFDSNFFLDFAPANVNKISYAASFGKTLMTDKEIAFISENIKNFNYISVREKSAKEILTELNIPNINITLDPTLLLSKAEWLVLDNRKFENKKFVLLYSLEKNDILERAAENIAKEKNLEIIRMIPSNKKDFIGYKNAYGPNEFISAFNNASYVVTNSFHGTVFSVIFHKQFTTILHKTRGTRMENLLGELGLTDRILVNEDSDNFYNQKIDFDMVDNKLKKLQNESIMFLRKAIFKED